MGQFEQASFSDVLLEANDWERINHRLSMVWSYNLLLSELFALMCCNGQINQSGLPEDILTWTG
jgi:hypothetical protein